MSRLGLLLFLGLPLIGAGSGYLLGEALLGRGSGVLVASASVVVGLLLAWGLWQTRPRPEATEEAETVEPPPPIGRARRDKGDVRVTKSRQGGKRR